MVCLGVHQMRPSAFGETEAPSLDALNKLLEQYVQPSRTTPTESALVREAAAHNSGLQIDGNEFPFDAGPAREAALAAVRDCLGLAIKLKQAEANDAIEPDDLSALFVSMGSCSVQGAKFMKALFGGDPPHFGFIGTISEDPEHISIWYDVDTKCELASSQALIELSNPLGANETLALSGRCLSQVGRAWHHVAGPPPHDVSTACCALPLPPLPYPANAVARRCRQQKRRTAAELFLATS